MGPWWTMLVIAGCEPETSPPAGDDDDDTAGSLHTGALAEHTGTTDPGPTGSYGVSALRAEPVATMGSVLRVTWTQEADASVQVEFEFDGETRRSPVRALAAGDHEELLLGVPFDAQVTFRLVLDGVNGAETTADETARTGALPAGVPDHVLEGSVPSGYDPDVQYFLVSISDGQSYFGGTWYALVIDREGRVVWARESEQRKVTMYARVSAAGDALLLDQNSYWGAFDGGWTSQVAAFRIDGSEVGRWDTFGLHHSFTQLPDGGLVYGSYTGGFGAYEENVLRLHPDGTPEVVLVCRDWLDSIGELDAYCGSNTVSYVAGSDSVLVSWFSVDSITEIDLGTGDVGRTFGHVNGAYTFDPPSSAFWYQHGPTYLANGNLLVSTHVTHDDMELVVREYEVDDASRTLRQVWSAGAGQGVTGNQMGEAHRLPNGNTFHNFGTNAHLREYTPDGQVVWELDWPIDNTVGRSEPILVDLYALAPERQ